MDIEIVDLTFVVGGFVWAGCGIFLNKLRRKMARRRKADLLPAPSPACVRSAYVWKE